MSLLTDLIAQGRRMLKRPAIVFLVFQLGLLIKRLRILGLPNDVITLTEMWLKERYFYVGIGNVNMWEE